MHLNAASLDLPILPIALWLISLTWYLKEPSAKQTNYPTWQSLGLFSLTHFSLLCSVAEHSLTGERGEYRVLVPYQPPPAGIENLT